MEAEPSRAVFGCLAYAESLRVRSVSSGCLHYAVVVKGLQHLKDFPPGTGKGGGQGRQQLPLGCKGDS